MGILGLSEGGAMGLFMLAAVVVLIISVFRIQYRNEKHWDEEEMIDPEKDEKSKDNDEH